ncbi:MAG: hypothetical protein WC584_02210 [Candidatus Pacearchaeota archaeon]
MTTDIIYNPEHFERMKKLVEEGVELRGIINAYHRPLNLHQLTIRSEAYERYQEIAQELHVLPEELARKWDGAMEKLIENKVYPFRK